MDFKKLFLAVVLTLVLATACSDEETGQEEDSQSSSGSSGSAESSSAETSGGVSGGETTMMEDTGAMVGEGEVTVGGFVVESPGVPERSVPEVATSPEAAQEYLDEARPVVDETVRDITGLIDPEVQVGEDGISLDLNLTSLEEASESVQNGADRLQEIEPPEGLGPINDQLVEAYEEVRPAYQNIVDAAQSGDPDEFASIVDESLPRIERFNDEVNSIVQDLERAADEANAG